MKHWIGLGVVGMILALGFTSGLTVSLPGGSRAAFEKGLDDFTEKESFATGLGPVFNSKSCADCHAQPAVGGASPDLTNSVVTHIARLTNGQFDPLTSLGGEVLQRRSIQEEKGSLSVVGEIVPREATIVSRRQTPPLFGAGLIESIRQDVILSHADPTDRNQDGISGEANWGINRDTGRTELGRFGWKADVPTLHHFAGLAYINELGITNPSFPKENLPQGKPIQAAWDASSGLEDDGEGVAALTDFMRLLAPLTPRGGGNSVTRGQQVFAGIGCASCHVPAMVAGDAPVSSWRGKPVPLYSDLLLHEMGSGLADGIVVGQASGSEWRTAPLWGLSRRTFYLHDGRTQSVTEAIQVHGGEALRSRNAFQDVKASDRQALLDFLGQL